MSYRKLSLVLGLALMLANWIFVRSAKADSWNKETIVTLNSSVKIPGKVLAPGTYVFKLLDSPSNRNIILIWNEDKNEMIATISAVSAYRPNISDQTILTFDTSESNVPMLKKWFYPGKNDGLELVYGKESPEAALPISEPQTLADETS